MTTTLNPAAAATATSHSTQTTPASTAPARLPAFIGVAHTRGYVPLTTVSVTEALAAARLNFIVTKAPVQAHPFAPNGTQPVPMVDHQATIRTNPDGSRQGLGIVKGRYQVVQNADAFAFGQHLVDEYGANVAAAAAYGKPVGAQTYLALRMQQTLDVGGSDTHDLYVLIRNSHDGSTCVNASIVPIRRVSVSEVATNIPQVPQRWKLRHSGDIAYKFQEATHTMRMVHQWVSTYRKVTYQLLSTPMSDDEFAAFTHRLLPTPRNAGRRSASTWATRRSLLHDLFTHAPTCSFGRHTRYAAVCAVNEYTDHYAAARSGNPTEARYLRNLGGQASQFKQRAWDLLADV